MDTIKLNPTELAQAVAIAIASMKGVTLKDTLPSSTQAALHGSGGLWELGENRSQHRASRGFGDEPKRSLGDDAQHALRSGEKPNEVEACFVFV